MTLLRQGRYADAWPFFRSRHRISSGRRAVPVDFPFAQWKGEPLAGKRVVVFPEQGYGDQIQFARFVPMLLAGGAEVTLLARPALVSLFRNSLPGARVIPAEGKVAFDDPDYWLMFLDLAWAAGATAEKVWAGPYLSAMPLPIEGPRTWRVGVKTRGNSNFAHDRKRSLSAEQAEALVAGLPGTIVSLDPEESGAKDFAETASIIETLDLVVSVDTSVSHLAGALNKRCFALIASDIGDWRWGESGESTLWYPNHRLFRSSDAEWLPAIARLIAATHDEYRSARVAPARGKA
jgi:hypothetical protein